jgi:hypothetical protein
MRLFFIFVMLCFFHPAFADMENIEGDDAILSELGQETLFVSLGSYCTPASLVRSCGLRKAAFPFDWNITLDLNKVIEMIDDGFAHFFDPQYLLPAANGSALYHTRYHIEFVHDGTWGGAEHDSNMKILTSKFGRRIQRFKNLALYPGKVYFLRSAYRYTMTDPHRIYQIEENVEISDEDAMRLERSLKNRFPNLDFTLIIVNNHLDKDVVVEKILAGGILMVRAAVEIEPEMMACYCEFFNQLVSSKN